MLGATPPDRTSCRRAQQEADNKTILGPCLDASNMNYAGRGTPPGHSFVGNVQMGFTKAVLAVPAILILLLFCTNLAPILQSPWSILQFTVPNSRFCCLPRALALPFLEVFQVYPPVLAVSPNGALELTDGSSNGTVKLIAGDYPTCQEVLAVHTFAFSYGKPFIGHYTPPECPFNRITWNLTVVSVGKQFDRLGIVYLGDFEVFRTSTAEPTTDGIRWTYLKDMTSFFSLFKDQQTIIFDLGNLINDVYTAPFNITLTASYFTARDSIIPADLILPISARKGAEGQPSVFTVPPATASNTLIFPRNIKRAVFTIAATGQSEEEFWWSNVLESDVITFPRFGELYGYSPFREVEVFIDEALAGVVWPYPVIFTGGVVPGLWRPIVGIDTFDLKEDEIDITPWLPLLCDGRQHNFTIRVSGLVDDGNGNAILAETKGSYWLVTGKIFIWLDEDGHITTGVGPYIHAPLPRFEVSSTIGTGPNGTNETLSYEVRADRSLSITAVINTSHGKEAASWHQSLKFSNFGDFSKRGDVEFSEQSTRGYEVSSSGYARQYSYPLYVYSAFKAHQDNITIKATVKNAKDVKVLGHPVFPSGLELVSAVEPSYPTYQGSWSSTSQSGNATYEANQTAQTSFSHGSTEQDLFLRGIRAGLLHTPGDFPPISVREELFRRHVTAVNGTVIEDGESLAGTSTGREHGSQRSVAGDCALADLPGRGNPLHWKRDQRYGV